MFGLNPPHIWAAHPGPSRFPSSFIGGTTVVMTSVTSGRIWARWVCTPITLISRNNQHSSWCARSAHIERVRGGRLPVWAVSQDVSRRFPID